MTSPPIACLLLEDAQLLTHCRQESMVGSGPGGQHRNRTASAVRLTHRPSGIEARCEEHREHRRNLAGALARLRLRLAISQRGGSQALWLAPYRQGSRLRLGAKGTAYPLALACCLDALAEQAGSLADAAASLGLSSSQLVKVLVADKEVHAAANHLRASHGRGPLHA